MKVALYRNKGPAWFSTGNLEVDLISSPISRRQLDLLQWAVVYALEGISIWRRGILMMEAEVFSASTPRIAFTRPAGILGYNVHISPPSPFKACWNLNRLLYKTTRGYLFPWLLIYGCPVQLIYSLAYVRFTILWRHTISALDNAKGIGWHSWWSWIPIWFPMSAPRKNCIWSCPLRLSNDRYCLFCDESFCVCVWTADAVASTFSYQSLDQQRKRSSDD